MAKVMIARMMFNPYMKRFLNEYCDNFPQCEHTRKQLKQVMDDYGSDPEYETHIMDLFLNSFVPFEKQLKRRDLALLAEEKCEFLHHMEINRIWTPTLDEEAKNHIWDYLIGAYLIVEILVRVPAHVMQEIEGMMKRHYTHVLNDEFDKAAFREAAERILLTLDDKEIECMTNYMWEFVTSDSTPIYVMIPEKYRDMAGHVFSTVKTEEGRKLFLDQLNPVITEIKARVGDTELDAHYGDSPEKKLSPEQEKKEKARVISHVLDVMTELIAKNKDAIKNIMTNPVESMQILLTQAIIPSLTRRRQAKTKSPEELKRLRELEDRELFGDEPTTEPNGGGGGGNETTGYHQQHQQAAGDTWDESAGGDDVTAGSATAADYNNDENADVGAAY